MQSGSKARESTANVALSIVLLLAAMLLPACHLHPLLDKTAPDHCAICVSLHAAAPIAVQAPALAAPVISHEHVIPSQPCLQPSGIQTFFSSRAPPSPSSDAPFEV